VRCQTDLLAVSSTASPTASPKSLAKRASSRHPESGQRLAGNARDPAGIAVTPETDTRKSLKRGLGAITHETLQRYRWPIRGASLQVLR